VNARSPNGVLLDPIVTAARMALCVLNVQNVQPVFASSAYTVPFCAPTNTRPPATVGCAYAETVSGNPNAHFSFRVGTWAALKPACSADCDRLFVASGLQPFHDGPVSAENGADSICAAQREGSRTGACANESAGKNKLNTTGDTEDTENKDFILCVPCILCGGECFVII
jgi:hypothetical protein